MTDETSVAAPDDPALLPGTPDERAIEDRAGLSVIRSDELAMLPGELRPHPSPFQYVMIAIILCVITAIEVGIYYLPDDFPRALYVGMLLALALTKFVTVVAFYMHLRVDRPIFRRFFIVGAIGAFMLYTIVLTTLHVFE
jgi:cytochrome c oxidase subunit 4